MSTYRRAEWRDIHGHNLYVKHKELHGYVCDDMYSGLQTNREYRCTPVHGKRPLEQRGHVRRYDILNITFHITVPLLRHIRGSCLRNVNLFEQWVHNYTQTNIFVLAYWVRQPLLFGYRYILFFIKRSFREKIFYGVEFCVDFIAQ